MKISLNCMVFAMFIDVIGEAKAAANLVDELFTSRKKEMLQG